jgi:prepilin-type processing-associated H-X9-DG protein
MIRMAAAPVSKAVNGYGGAYFLFADGSVHFLPYPAASVMPALASRAGGEDVALAD